MEVSIEVQSFCYDHAGTAGERVSLKPRRSVALELAYRARPAEQAASLPRSLASGGLLWPVLNTGGVVAVVILPSTLPYLRDRPYEHLTLHIW